MAAAGGLRQQVEIADLDLAAATAHRLFALQQMQRRGHARPPDTEQVAQLRMGDVQRPRTAQRDGVEQPARDPLLDGVQRRADAKLSRLVDAGVGVAHQCATRLREQRDDVFKRRDVQRQGLGRRQRNSFAQRARMDAEHRRHADEASCADKAGLDGAATRGAADDRNQTINDEMDDRQLLSNGREQRASAMLSRSKMGVDEGAAFRRQTAEQSMLR